MSADLKSQLRPGDQIIAIADARFPKHISPEQHYSQRVGDIIMVNNATGYKNMVGGTGITGADYKGRPCLGLGSSLDDGTYRRATPDDKGYLATREQWHAIKDAEIKQLKSELWGKKVDFLVAVAIAMVCAVGLLVKGGAI